ncbi:endonuclease G, mitochondrial-like, partial [Rhinichthys klamathensis goyatoka]|uniref:endonuclease G, mitochondrial-like n=1 Tax=Rhinichthys klamathensis goyatoka TaxID=3034132 RepID=UPI0024B4C456
MDIESKFSETDEKNKENKASESVAMDIIGSPKIEEYKLIDKVPSPTQILQNQFYITLYDNQTRNAAWVYEILNKSTLADNVVYKIKDFKQDESVHKYFRTPEGEDTYKDTGYDRGHLAAAANHRWCQKAYKDTYWLSNAVPQQRGFNRGIWRTLENLCRALAEKREVRNVHVYTGPLYLSKYKKDGKCFVEYEILGGKAVPTHLFKVIIVENDDGKVLAPECYKMPNEKPTDQEKLDNKGQSSIETCRSKLNQYKVGIEVIEKESGLIFEEREVKEESKDNQRNSRLKEEITDETWKMPWTAENR